jgi:hypothetical protein
VQPHGFGVRVWGEDAKAYIVQIKRHRKQFRKAVGKVGETKQEEAREAAIAFRGTVKAGRDPRAEERAARDAWTLRDAIGWYLGAYSVAKKLSVDHHIDCVSRFENHTPDRLKGMKLTDITQTMIAGRHKEITTGLRRGDSRARGGARRANTWLTLTGTLFNLGIAQGQCTINPTKGIRPNPETHRDRYLSPRELSTL